MGASHFRSYRETPVVAHARNGKKWATAGFSSLFRLRHLPIDRVKIDGIKIADIATDTEARGIVQAIIGLVHGLGLEVVAEGVEHKEQIEVLKIMGCDAVQEYGIARPMAEADFASWNAELHTALVG